MYRTFIALTALLSSFSSAREITMTTSNWEPFYGENLRNGGPVTEVVVEAFKRAGHQASIEFQPWARTMHSGRNKKVDIIMGAYYTRERAHTFLYSKPLMHINVGIYASTKVPFNSYSKLRQLSNFTIGVGKGWANSPEFDTAPFLTREPARNQAINVKKLYNSRIDMIVLSLEVYKHEVKKQNFQDRSHEFKLLEPLLSKHCLHLLINKEIPDHQEVISGFNRAFSEMLEDGTYMKILKAHGIAEASGVKE